MFILPVTRQSARYCSSDANGKMLIGQGRNVVVDLAFALSTTGKPKANDRSDSREISLVLDFKVSEFGFGKLHDNGI